MMRFLDEAVAQLTVEPARIDDGATPAADAGEPRRKRVTKPSKAAKAAEPAAPARPTARDQARF
jgi:hypothetical protein